MKKHLTAILAGLACAISLLCLIRVNSLSNRIYQLDSNLDSQAHMLRSQVDAITGSIRDSLEEQASLIADSGYEFGAADMGSLTVPVTIAVTPREYIPNVTSATLTAGGREYPMELLGGQFTATVNLMLVEDLQVEAVSFEEAGAVRTQKLEWNLSPRHIYLPEVRAYLTSGSAGRAGDGVYSYHIQGEIMVDAYGGEPPLEIRSISVAEDLDGELINRTRLDLEAGLVDSREGEYLSYCFSEFDREYSVPYGSTHTLYLEAEDRHGFIHRCILSRYTVDGSGNGGIDQDRWQWDGAACNLYTKDGKLVYQNYPEY